MNNVTKSRCGSRILPNGLEVPAQAHIKVAPSGREYYVSGIEYPDTAIIRYTDTGEVKKVALKNVKV